MKARTSYVRTILVAALSLVACLGTARAEQIGVAVDAKQRVGAMSTWFEPSVFAGWSIGAHAARGSDYVGEFIRDAGGSTRGMIRLTVEDLVWNSKSVDEYRQRLRRNKETAELYRRIEASGAQVLIEFYGTPPWTRSRTRGESSGREYAPRDDAWNEWENVVYETVRYFNGELGLKNAWYEFWGEPDFTRSWHDTPEKFLRMWKYFHQGAKRADPNARVGGCGVSWFQAPFGFEKGGTPILKQFLAFSKQNNLKVDFIAPHYFHPSPEGLRAEVKLAQSWLNENGYPNALIVIGEYNPRDKMLRLPWPSQPSALGRVTDTEMAAAYVLSAMKNLEASGSKGYQCYAHLTSFDQSGEFAKPNEGDWGARTHAKLAAIKKAVYHALTIAGRMKRNIVSSTVNDPHAGEEAFPHFNVMSGADGGTLTILMWNFVTNPYIESSMKMREMLGPEGVRALRHEASDSGRDESGVQAMKRLLDGEIPPRISQDPQMQRAVTQARQYLQRQAQLVTEEHDVELRIANFPSAGGYKLTRYLIDATHSNSYYYFVKQGLEAAKQHQELESVDSRQIKDLSEIGKIRMKPYSVTLLVLEAAGSASAGPGPTGQ